MSETTPDIAASSYAWQASFMTFYYVYILRSLSNPDKKYFGFTENLGKRLNDHNSGKSSHTSKDKPWKIVTAIAFTDRKQAMEYEKYLKSHAGRAYASKHFWPKQKDQ